MKYCLKMLFVLLISAVIFAGCKSKVKERDDEIYSRHLQQHVKLTIITTPLPDDKSDMNLLLLNDGQDAKNFGVKEILDSLYKKKLIEPLIVVAIHADDRLQEYGVNGVPDYKNNGSRADKYASFIDNELYDFVKKKAGVRKFKTVSIAGCSQGGLSALDIAWDNADKIDKVGVFSGSFWWRDKDASDGDYADDKDRIMQNKIRSSRKRRKLKYRFYAGNAEEKGDRDKEGIIDVVDDTKDLVEIIKKKNVCPPG
ncbi:MAG: esterase family protein, partial [Aquabacterium sp.]|nr:esterase family protein [Ferruginibacter sp.]